MKNEIQNEYNETKQRGTPEFPIQIYLVNKEHPMFLMPLHWHKDLEFIRVTSGKMDLYINNVLYEAKAGDIFVINCKLLHRAIPKDCTYECIVFDLELLAKINGLIYNDYIYPIVAGNLVIDAVYHKDDSALYLSLNAVFDKLKNTTTYYKLAVISELLKIFELLYSNGHISEQRTDERNNNQSDVISKLLNWIESNYTEHITLESLSEKVGLTPNYLCRIFKSYTGKTPIEYVNFIRIQNVCREIKWGDKSITQIATDNGFNDISYFCKVFKKQKGVSAKKFGEK